MVAVVFAFIIIEEAIQASEIISTYNIDDHFLLYKTK